MKQTINSHDFIDAFRNHDRQDNFSYAGLHALYDYLEAYEEDTGEEIELDVITICCDFTEYASLEEFQSDYGSEEYPDIESIQDATMFIGIPDSNGFVIQSF